MDLFIHLIKDYGYLGLFSLLTLGMFGLPIPDETILAFTGFLISKKYLSPGPSVLTAFFGSACGVTLNYLVGRTLGLPLLERYGHYLRITPRRLEQAHQWFEAYGQAAVFFGYFFPGIRHLASFIAGVSRLEYRYFAPFAYAGGLLWVCGFIALGYWVGEEWVKMVPLVRSYLWKVLAGVAALALLYFLVRRFGPRNGKLRS